MLKSTRPKSTVLFSFACMIRTCQKEVSTNEYPMKLLGTILKHTETNYKYLYIVTVILIM